MGEIFSGGMTALWLVIMVVLLIVEGAVTGLVSIWFALGALAAMICAILGAPLWLQIVWFLAVSVAALVLTRPLVRKYINAKVQATNADALIGRECVVTEKIDNIMGTGAVKIEGKEWTARAEEEGSKYEKGQILKVKKISGVKLIVNSD